MKNFIAPKAYNRPDNIRFPEGLYFIEVKHGKNTPDYLRSESNIAVTRILVEDSSTLNKSGLAIQSKVGSPKQEVADRLAELNIDMPLAIYTRFGQYNGLQKSIEDKTTSTKVVIEKDEGPTMTGQGGMVF
jgi:hypothetical protein